METAMLKDMTDWENATEMTQLDFASTITEINTELDNETHNDFDNETCNETDYETDAATAYLTNKLPAPIARTVHMILSVQDIEDAEQNPSSD